MKTKLVFVAGAIALGLAGPMIGTSVANAQCLPGERVDGTTADMARAKARAAGYTNVVMSRKGCDSYWHGTANQGGRQVGIVVSPGGEVTVESVLDQPPGMEGGTSYTVPSDTRAYPQTATPVYPESQRAIPESQRAYPEPQRAIPQYR